jgi:hypothetical protein
VSESARVRLNGRNLGALIGPTFMIRLDASLLSDRNVLEVHVTNLMANRIAALDKAGVPWRTFYNVNFPARLPQNRGTDGLFTAAKWEPLEAGLVDQLLPTNRIVSDTRKVVYYYRASPDRRRRLTQVGTTCS